MGAFDIFKSKKNSKRIDFENDSVGEIGAKLAKAGVISVPVDNNHNTFEDDLSHLDENGELPWGWLSAKRDFIEPRDKKIMDLHVAAKNALNVKDEKRLIEEFLKAFWGYKEECEKMGECFVKYFSDMHEKCHNNKTPCFSLAEPMNKRLDYINANYDQLVTDEEKKERILSTLDKDIAKLIFENAGILQSDLITSFDPIVKSDISSKLL